VPSRIVGLFFRIYKPTHSETASYLVAAAPGAYVEEIYVGTRKRELRFHFVPVDNQFRPNLI
jgi:hypothetical protein